MGNRSFRTARNIPEHRALTADEHDSLQAQRDLVGDFVRERYDTYSLPVLRSDLSVLQQILDDGVFSSRQQDEWTAVGIVFGDVLAAELGLEWCAFSDEHGTEPALRTDDFSLTLFPRRMLLSHFEDDKAIELDSLMEQLASHLDDLQDRQSRRAPKRLVTAT